MIKNHYTIFGINGCNALLLSKRFKIIDIVIKKGGLAESNPKINHALGYFGGHVKIYPSLKFKENFRKWRTQGIVITFSGKVEQSLSTLKDKGKNIGLLALDQIEDPQNLGQIIRTAECAGIDGIIIPKHSSCGITDTVIQVSQGAFVNMPIYEVSNLHQAINSLKKDEFWIIALENDIKAKHWHQIDYKGRVMIIVGSEGKGIKKLVLENSDFYSTIPMQGKTNSLNVSAAVSAVLFERLRQLTLK